MPNEDIKRRLSLKERLNAGEFITAPGVFDLVSAKLAASFGFPALYMTGFGVTASHLGLPDAGLATYSDMVERARAIAAATEVAVIADADTGYGGLLNVRHTVRGYEAAGVAAIQLEDQVSPKKCGHVLGREVVSIEEMVLKIRVAVESRRSDDFLIVARTDARTTLGIEAAIDRAHAYAEAGADVLFIESPETVSEMKRIGEAINRPLLANMVEGGRTPILPPAELKALGYAIAIYPVAGLLAAAEAMRRTYAALAEVGTTLGAGLELYPFKVMCTLLGLDEVSIFDARWAGSGSVRKS